MYTEKSSKIKTLFISGQVQAVYRLFQKEGVGKDDFTWILGSLCLLGKIDEAQEICKKRKLESVHYFFLTLVSIRISDFEKAKVWIKKLQINSRENNEASFFYFQAMAIYAYYKSRYKCCLVIAKRSRNSALNLNESFWKILALDLLGHTHVQMGNAFKGIAFLEEAYQLASLLNNTTFQLATNISILNYQALYTSDPEKHIQKIEKALKTIAQNDNFSEGSLLLTLSHLYMLVGQMEKADRLLHQSQKIIFGSSTPRHKVQWFFEKSYYCFLSGQVDLSLSYLYEAHKIVDSKNEKKLLLKILGLKRKIFNSINKCTKELDQELILLTIKVGDPRAINILARDKLLEPETSEDPIQGMFDSYFSKKSNVEIIEAGYFGIFKQGLKISNMDKDQSFLITGIWKNGILILTPKAVLVKKSGVSQLLLKALILISSKKMISKDELVETIWGYQYDPIRHDTLIYTLIHRLRFILGPLEKGLIGENHHYSFTYNFHHHEISRDLAKYQSESENLHSTLISLPIWNIRQHRALDLIAKGQIFKVSDYSLTFNVSIITALRDLRELKEARLINVYGKGRATAYAT